MVDGGFSVTHLINYCLQMNNSKNKIFKFFNCAGLLHYLFTLIKNLWINFLLILSSFYFTFYLIII